jgi:hypothetical protein
MALETKYEKDTPILWKSFFPIQKSTRFRLDLVNAVTGEELEHSIGLI